MHSLLENYLSEVAAHLSALPTKRRNEELREMRAHLLSAVEAYQELGETEEKAVQSTLQQFGVAKRVSSELVTAWRRGHGSWLDMTKGGVFGAAGLWGIYGLCGSLGYYLGEHPDAYFAHRSHFYILFYVLYFGPPIILGGLVGGRFARGAVKGAACGIGLGYVGPMVAYDIVHAWDASGIAPVSLFGLLQAVCVIGAVWVGSRWRKGLGRLARR